MPRGRNRTTRSHTRHKKARSPVKNGTAIRRQIPFTFEGRQYMIVLAGKETEVYTVVGRRGSTLRKVRNFKEKAVVLDAWTSVQEAHLKRLKEIARKKRVEALS